MASKKGEFLKRLLATFRVEAREHIEAISAGLVRMEKGGDVDEMREILETIYRDAHSLKGASRSVDQVDIESICQVLESIFKKIKDGFLVPTAGSYDVMHRAVDVMTQLNNPEAPPPGKLAPLLNLLSQVETGITPVSLPPAPTEITPSAPHPMDKIKRAEILREVEKKRKAFSEKEKKNPEVLTGKPVRDDSTIRLSTKKLDHALLQAEELLMGKLTGRLHSREVDAIVTELETWRKKLAATPKTKDQLQESFEWNRSALNSLLVKLRRLHHHLEKDNRALGTLIDNHLEDMKKVLLLPFSTLTQGFPKMIRDLARDKGKNVALVIQGEKNEIDKRVLEEVKDPLLHLLRNAVDHGIELPEERIRKNKPAEASLRITIKQSESSWVELTVADDGGGIDTERIKAKVVASGLMSPDEAASAHQNQLMDFIFQSDFSTSPIITDVSGRGLGLAIVREKVKKLGGDIAVETQLFGGTAFRLRLPLTLATFRGVQVFAGERKFIVPTLNVERVMRVLPDEIKTVENRETLHVDNRVVAYVSLGDVLGIPGSNNESIEKGRYLQVLVIASGADRIAFAVDEVNDEEEVLVKDLGKQLVSVKNISGATILGTGEVVPLLNTSDLVDSAVEFTRGETASPLKLKKVEPRKQSILVVEDSITSRMLLKNILESSGFQVKVAVDGVAGWTALKEEPIDLVISDVDMPRMDGFQLTARIREDKKFAEIPVILITALDRKEDREKGIEAGANAYIVKSNFDQGNLLAAIKRIV